MPDAAGNFKGISVPAAAWERVFGPKYRCVGCGGPTYRMDCWNTARFCSPCEMVQPSQRRFRDSRPEDA